MDRTASETATAENTNGFNKKSHDTVVPVQFDTVDYYHPTNQTRRDVVDSIQVPCVPAHIQMP